MRVSRIVLLLVALLAGGLAAFLAMRPGPAPTVPAPETQVIEEARAQILVAKQPIGMGERLSDQNIEWQAWPEGAVRPEYVTIAATPEALTEMGGSVARFEFFAGEPIRTDKLVRTEQGYLSAVLDKGMRGISVPVQADSASGGFIVPNDHVDVILTRPSPSGDLSETILSNVRVLAINTRLGELGSTGGPDDPTSPRTQIFAGQAIATLELDPGQGETIINAISLGRLSLALRSIVDFSSDDGAEGTQRNKPIKIIRGGQEATVTTAAPATAVTPAAYDESRSGAAAAPVTP
ncbi:MAG TPA: Flp pilus assembly protein CpaB [Devosia sp.]|nr:Flp pilus assembly protein CpaB [Devosia sp.]